MKEVTFPIHSTFLGGKEFLVVFPDECACCGAQAVKALQYDFELSYYEMPYRKTLRLPFNPRYCAEHAKALEDDQRKRSWLNFYNEAKTLRMTGFEIRYSVVTLLVVAFSSNEFTIVCNRDEFAEKLHRLNSHSRIVDTSVAGQRKEWKEKTRRRSALMRKASLPAFLVCSALGLFLGLISISAGRFTQWAEIGAMTGAMVGATLLFLSFCFSLLGREK